MNLFSEFDKKVDAIIKKSNGKTLILWGYGYSGQFFEHILNRRGKRIDYIIDNFKDYPSRFCIYTSSILDELDPGKCFVLEAFYEDEESKSVLNRCGYNNNSYLNLITEFFGTEKKILSYYDWFEYLFELDIKAVKHNECGDGTFYSFGNDYSIIKILDEFQFMPEDGFFDFGCGKGGTLLLAEAYCGKLGGVEYDNDLYSIAKKNFQKCGMVNYELFCDDASNIKTELDGYNYFYMYNPFNGDTFIKVIENIEESYRRKPRTITLIYSGVTCHKLVIRNEIFKFTKRIPTEYWNKYTNIYMIG
ncbi:class I SAM-dependent methyltransferase [Butyrivibrio sp. XB500-5]|uniref:class I SAM-dependent methyltransferase n=1 Tax=Butyrivibrio sp. XB500-5 TaxID=2364880 RepID=UPI000EA87D49|nr:class I SAM-dependent methyltransferase [Butyrivibrio sp. XB500-5]RKM59523.1 class I SAM-dependent methyltransferase [Butyrivibrio sp. XB500-5]